MAFFPSFLTRHINFSVILIMARAEGGTVAIANSGQGTLTMGDGVELALPRLLPMVKALHHVVEVDYTVPGCPPEGKQVWNVVQAVISGELPPAAREGRRCSVACSRLCASRSTTGT